MSANHQEKIGFIGIGFMGVGIAANILKKGYPLTFLGRSKKEPSLILKNLGGTEVATLESVAASSSIIFICVTGSKQVEEIIRGANGLLHHLKPGTVVVDCSTSDPNSTLSLADELSKIQVDYADAPLGGTPQNAEEGTLSTMIGCRAEVYDRLLPIINTWAAKSVHIGSVGDGHRMKLLNNFLSLGYGALYSEALALARKIGISPARFDSVIRGGRIDCGFYQTFMKYNLEGDRAAHKFTLNNANKDLMYLSAMADAAGVANPLVSAVKNSYTSAVALGAGEDFVPMLADHIASMNGIKIPS